MLCGFAKELINPPLDLPIMGSYEVKYPKARLDDFYARAVAFDDGVRRAVVIAVDACYMSTAANDEIRHGIAERCGIDLDAIIVNCTHTHAGAYNRSEFTQHIVTDDPSSLLRIEAYARVLTDGVIAAGVRAFSDMKPAKLSYATERAEGVANIRRYRMKSGRVVTNPGAHNPNIECALGEVNDTVKLLKIEREGAKDIYAVNFGMHATTVRQRAYFSADYPGILCKTLEDALGVESIFLQGAEGDVVQINTLPTPEVEAIIERDAQELGKNRRMATFVAHRIAAAVLRCHGVAKEIGDAPIAYKRIDMRVPSNKSGGDLEEAKRIAELHRVGRHFELPHENEMDLTTIVANARRIVDMECEPDFYDYSLYALAVGGFAFAGLPGEPFTEIGRKVAAVSPYESTMVLALTNCMTTYFPTTEAFSEGGYEVATTRVGPGSAEVVVNAAKEALCDARAIQG